MIIDSGVVTGSLQVSGSLTVKGNLTVDGNINGTITGSVTSASYATFAQNASTASLATTNLFTASVSNNIITFTEGDGTTFNLTVATGSGTSTVSASYAVSSSQAANATLFNSLSSSQFPQLVANNTFTGNNVFANITGSNAKFNTASIEYLSVIYQTSSVVYSSGSNQFGDAAGDVQTLFGTVDVKTGPVLVTGSLNVSGGITGSLNGSNLALESVPNNRLASSFITIGTNSIGLGASSTTLAGLTSVTSAAFTGSLSGNASTVTTNANLTGNVTSVGNATTIAENVITNAMIVNNTITSNKLVSSTISGIGLGSNLATLTIGTGLSGTSYNGSTSITIANTGVTSIASGSGISLSGTTGAVTISNTITNNNQLTNGAGYQTTAGTSSLVEKTVAVDTTGNLVYGTMGTNDYFRIMCGGASNAGYVAIDTADDGTEPIYVRQYSGVFTTLTRTATILDGSGNTTFPGDVTAYSSDERLKENVQNIPNALDKVLSLNGVTFDWKQEAFDAGFNPSIKEGDAGVLAQQVQSVLPQAVRYAPFDRNHEGESISGKDYLTIQYEKLAPLFIEAIKEQQAQIELLKAELAELKNK